MQTPRAAATSQRSDHRKYRCDADATGDEDVRRSIACDFERIPRGGYHDNIVAPHGVVEFARPAAPICVALDGNDVLPPRRQGR